ELVRHSDSPIDRHQLGVFLNSYQRVAPLTMGELWAWPSMLKLALIENLRRLADETLAARRAPPGRGARARKRGGPGGGGARRPPPPRQETPPPSRCRRRCRRRFTSRTWLS